MTDDGRHDGRHDGRGDESQDDCRDAYDAQGDVSPRDALATRLMVAFRRADRAIQRHEGDVVHAHGLTPAQFGALDALRRRGPLSVGGIIEETLATSGNMTVVIRNMERDGYIRRETDPEDRRSTVISLTDDGRRIIDETMAEHRRHLGDLFAVFSADEQRELIRLLERCELLR
ncbi:MarR family winged helix-turn-helix transcriptional regulator [Bifidobacterium samirii]|uniref:MarR family transcriptional regulator n=1 Tax=Bifidobacterium samirii TaxID=2306974 RepID=A0A430FWJ3_9BIFI|nr:MarR family transcriptional regulator [Bifidobacterium samirii]RSX58745.1 MarR family transcriptional regulator [Bifidobacterium samirii]